MEIKPDELMKQAELSKVEFIGGPRDGDKLTPIPTNIEHIVKTHAMWWVDKKSVHFYLVNIRNELYYMMYAGNSVDKLLEATSEVYGKIPWDLATAVPLLRTIEKGACAK